MVHLLKIVVYFRKSSDGKSGLEVLMLIIEHALRPTTDESQRIVAGPLIADLVRKVIPSLTTTHFQASGEIQPHLPTLLNVIITQLSTATKPDFIQVRSLFCLTNVVLNSSFCESINSPLTRRNPDVLFQHSHSN